ncbi:mechanosensitive ion channel family protein [Salinimicrobium xinjiangense]|uniref:mechanosensitive ion channel family protein n=1 Tax=Salinimicrobium xinjiangense TaxID=438596 RepID=UPI000402EB54|nr:mechanosensitive ion channel family protein [Salinimicrobium xinjiangense]
MESREQQEEHEIEEILKDKKVREALKESSGEKKSSSKEQSSALGLTTIIFLVAGTVYFLVQYQVIPIPVSYVPLVQRILPGLLFISIILVISRLLKKILDRKIVDKSTVYNLHRIINLFSVVFIFAVSLSLLFSNWYATMVSFGVGSLILGLALQSTFTSFFGWIYLLIRKPYEVGDRIKIGPVYGDVIRVGYLDTTLWEFRGDYLSGDHPSGRVVRFTNSKVFTEYIYNYSWPLFPFIWNELKIFVSHDSDLLFINKTIKRIAEEEIGEAMTRRIKRYNRILKSTLVEKLEVREVPSVLLKVNENTWIEITVRYLVNPKSSGTVKTSLLEHVMQELKRHPDKVKFPN